MRGLRVLVTRPRSQALELALRLKRLGARVVAAPAIRIAAPRSYARLDAGLRGLASYDAVVFTSANGVAAFFDRARRVLGRRPPCPRRVFAIGPGTARAVARSGWRGAAVPESYRGEALARRLGRVRGWRILIPRAAKAREVLPKALARAGAEVVVAPAYRTILDPAGARRIRLLVRGGKLDAVTFTSCSTVESFTAAAGPAHARRLLQRAAAASIGPITSASLRRLGARRIVEASSFTTAGLARALADHFSRRRCAHPGRKTPASR